MIWSALPPSAAPGSPATSAPSDMANAAAATVSTPIVHPLAKARPFVRARAETSTKINRTIGIGLMAMPIACGSVSPTAVQSISGGDDGEIRIEGCPVRR